MVVVRTVGTRFEAELLAAKLGAHGVLWQIRDRRLVPTTHPIGFLEVMVPREELEVAEEVLSPESTDDDRSGDEAAVAASGRVHTPAVRTLRVLLALALAGAAIAFVGGWLLDLLRFLDVVR